jgi:hypothetical protein
MSRILGIELRRSAALGSALVVLVVGALALYFAEGIGFATGWMQLAMAQRLYLALLWPLALAAGAWQARREHRSRVGELFASTPRPRLHRAVPTLGAMAVAVVGGYLAMGLAGGLWIIGTAEYLPAQAFVVTAVGALALIAAAWLGLAIGRLLPWTATAPALGVAGLGLLLSIPGATRPNGWLALVFSPIYEMNRPEAYATVPIRVSASQAAWLFALAVAGLLLFASSSWRSRVAAVLPLAAGAALAIAVMPHQNRFVTDAVDPVARELVCADGEPRVCVSRVHSGLLSELVEPARAGLAVLKKLPGGPVEVHEDTFTFGTDYYPPFRTDVALLRVSAGTDGHLADRDNVLADVVGGAFDSPPGCERFITGADRLAAAYWLIGRPPVAPRSEVEYEAAAELDIEAAAVERWNSLRGLPGNEAMDRVVALRQAAVKCEARDGLFP